MIYAIFMCGSLIGGCQLSDVVPNTMVNPREHCQNEVAYANQQGNMFHWVCMEAEEYNPWSPVAEPAPVPTDTRPPARVETPKPPAPTGHLVVGLDPVKPHL